MGGTAIYLQWEGHIGTGDPVLDGNLQAVDIVTTPLGTFLYAGTGQGCGITAYEVSVNGGLLVEIDRVYFPSWLGGAVGGTLDYAVIDGVTQLVFGGGDATGTGRLLGYQLGTNGQIDWISQTGGLSAGTWHISDIACSTSDWGALYVVDSATGLLRTYLPGGTGGLTLSGASYELGIGTQLETVTVGGQEILLATNLPRGGLVSFSIDGVTGQLQEADYAGAEEGLGVATPTALKVVEAFGETFVILGAADTSSLSVMKLDASGGWPGGSCDRRVEHSFWRRPVRGGGRSGWPGLCGSGRNRWRDQPVLDLPR